MKLGRYHVLQTIGRGGMGQVFGAWDTQLERRVAIKVLRSEHSGELALREARCLARVAHPNVVGVHEVGRANGLVFIAMELVDGPDLRRWLCEGPRRWTDVVARIVEAGRGLAAVHRAGLVHGDVKPGNLLIGEDGRVRIADFGLARVRARAVDPALVQAVRELANTVERELGEVVEVAEGSARAKPSPGASSSRGSRGPGGTRAYMAPECLTGAEGSERADQYSLCVTAWEALFGVRPFVGSSAETILTAVALGRIERGAGRPLGMSRAVESVLLRGLHEDPRERWPSLEALVEALAHAGSSRAGRRARSLALGAFGVAFVASLGALALGLGRERGPAPRGATVATNEVCADGSRPEHESSVWGGLRLRALELRAMRAEPRDAVELQAATATLGRWERDWRVLWDRACVLDPPVRDCLRQEHARFEVVVEELAQERRAVPSVSRELLAELGSPFVCLAELEGSPRLGTPARASAPQLRTWARIAELEHDLAAAIQAADRPRVRSSLTELERVVQAIEDPHLGARGRVRLERWRVEELVARGSVKVARSRLREALVEAERLGLERERYDLLLARVRLAHARGEPALDDLATLHGLAQSLQLGVEARSELALVEASQPQASPHELLVQLDRVLWRLEAAATSTADRRLHARLLIARGRLREDAGQPDLAVEDARVAQAMAREAGAEDLVEAQVLLAIAAAKAGRCDLSRDAVEGMRATLRYDPQPIEQLRWLLDIIHAFPEDAPAACRSAQRMAWLLAMKLSSDAESEL